VSLFKEQWPYFKLNPINWLIRWSRNRRNRKALHIALDKTGHQVGIRRRDTETDQQFADRILRNAAMNNLVYGQPYVHKMIESVKLTPPESKNIEPEFKNIEPEYVFYSPELDMFDVCLQSAGFMFKDEGGEFHLKYFLNDHMHPFKTYHFYLIGEL
jgi:uncharacterized protein YjiS (DUF1127 family)